MIIIIIIIIIIVSYFLTYSLETLWLLEVLETIKLYLFVCLFVWVYGISTFVGYLMPNPFLYKPFCLNNLVSNHSV